MVDLAQQLVGISPSIVAIRSYLSKLADSAVAVLITGETGTGKERVARALHEMSARRRQRFVAINCAAMPDGLIESELFGHARGAFTGATAATKGYFAEANGGTLFLDEIGEMSVGAQAKLLRVVEAREIQRVGSSHSVPVDVRIIAATNQAIETLVACGQFRADLYYRLNVAHIDLPCLKDRREDIPVLFKHLLMDLNQRHQRAVGMPDRRLLQCLMAHDWPGNVRELRNVVEALFIDPPMDTISLEDLPPPFRAMFARYEMTPSTERDRLVACLKEVKWNKVQAAKSMNWSRMTLYRKLAKYQIETLLTLYCAAVMFMARASGTLDMVEAAAV